MYKWVEAGNGEGQMGFKRVQRAAHGTLAGKQVSLVVLQPVAACVFVACGASL